MRIGFALLLSACATVAPPAPAPTATTAPPPSGEAQLLAPKIAALAEAAAAVEAARDDSIWAFWVAGTPHRISPQAEALKKLDLARESFAERLRHTPLAAALQWADSFLTATEPRWKERLTAAHVASRGDLPAMLKPGASLDAAFPKGRIAERGTQLL